ncbi:MAG: DUF3574 domain-containing protein [Lachnospiraceae bacterium]|nr:DUF3574 domain-containing protein [Lachnospiraceae bacterium]
MQNEKSKIVAIKSKSAIVIILLLVINLVFSAWLAIHLLTPKASGVSELGLASAEQTYLFIGTNDKDTHQAEIPFHEAKEIVAAVLANHGVTDFTTWDAHGGWLGTDNVATYEQTIVYILYTQDETLLEAIVDELCVRLNQSSISIFMPQGNAGLYFAEDQN